MKQLFAAIGDTFVISTQMFNRCKKFLKFSLVTKGEKYSRMDQVKFKEDSL